MLELPLAYSQSSAPVAVLQSMPVLLRPECQDISIFHCFTVAEISTSSLSLSLRRLRSHSHSCPPDLRSRPRLPSCCSHHDLPLRSGAFLGRSASRLEKSFCGRQIAVKSHCSPYPLSYILQVIRTIQVVIYSMVLSFDSDPTYYT